MLFVNKFNEVNEINVLNNIKLNGIYVVGSTLVFLKKV